MADGSSATETRCPRYVRFSPDSDHIADAPTRRVALSLRALFENKGWLGAHTVEGSGDSR
jgi:hypothetical protein